MQTNQWTEFSVSGTLLKSLSCVSLQNLNDDFCREDKI